MSGKRHQNAEDWAVVVGATRAIVDYEKHGVYICQAGRTFRACSHMAFYATRKIHRHIPAILKMIDLVLLSSEGVQRALTDASSRAVLGQIVRQLELTKDARSGRVRKVVLLSKPDSPQTLVLPQDIINDYLSRSGKPFTFVQAQRYILIKALEAGPSKTSELLELSQAGGLQT